MNGSNRIRLVKQRATDRQVQTEAVATTAAGYIRVSTEEQASNGHGLEIQDRAIRSFAESQGYRLIDVVSDPGVSGAKRPEERPGFQKIIETSPSAEVLSLAGVENSTASPETCCSSVTSDHDLREQYEVVLRGVTEPIDTATPMGAMIFAILASFAAEDGSSQDGR
jgi:site-specific DNA recombinase